MQTVTTIGLDIAKSVFQGPRRRRGRQRAHPSSAEAPLRADILREAAALPGRDRGLCHLASLVRELKALGHTVRLMPPAYVKPYVKRQKNNAADAEAICEAVTRANLRFVETKTPEQQSCLMLHRTRQLFIRQQTSVINAIRAPSGRWDRSPGGTQGCCTTACYCHGCQRPARARGCTGVSGCPWRPTADAESADPGVRPPDLGLAPIQ